MKHILARTISFLFLLAGGQPTTAASPVRFSEAWWQAMCHSTGKIQVNQNDMDAFECCPVEWIGDNPQTINDRFEAIWKSAQMSEMAKKRGGGRHASWLHIYWRKVDEFRNYLNHMIAKRIDDFRKRIITARVYELYQNIKKCMTNNPACLAEDTDVQEWKALQKEVYYVPHIGSNTLRRFERLEQWLNFPQPSLRPQPAVVPGLQQPASSLCPFSPPSRFGYGTPGHGGGVVKNNYSIASNNHTTYSGGFNKYVAGGCQVYATPRPVSFKPIK